MGPGRRVLSLAAALACAAGFAPAVASGATISATGGAVTLNDNFTDDGVCSLREMVAIANSDSIAGIEDSCTIVDPLADDTINLGAGEYELQTPIQMGMEGIDDGDLEVDDLIGNNRLTIIGQGRATTSIDGNDHDRIFEASGANFRLEGLTVRNGQVTSNNGGGIVSGASLFLEDVAVTGNTILTAGSGGGIFVSGMSGPTLTLSNSSVDTNISAGTGGGIELSQNASLTTDGSSAVSGNTAASTGGGINYDNLGTGDITLNAGTVVDGNTGTFNGGGITHISGGVDSDLTIQGAFVQGNHVVAIGASNSSGGGIHFVGSDSTQDFTVTDGGRVSGNTAAGNDATGAGINAVMNQGNFSITNGQVANNITTVAPDANDGNIEGGGGIALTGAAQATITNTTIATNQVVVNDADDEAAAGGILDNGRLRIVSSTINGNTAQGGGAPGGSGPIGGGMYAPIPAGPTEVINSTFSANSTSGAVVPSMGGGLAVNVGAQPLELVHSTFFQNSAQFGALNISGGAAFDLRGNLFDEDDNGCFPVGLAEQVNAFNVEDGTSCVGSNADTDRRNAITNLGPLADNGGPTRTHALLIGPDSLAINAVPASQCLDLNNQPLTVDQRGRSRPFPAAPGAPCDAGAYELGDIDGDGIFDTFDACPTQFGPPPGCPVPQSSTTTAENPECQPLRDKISKLSKKIKKAADPDLKAKLKKKRRNARKQLAALGCAP